MGVLFKFSPHYFSFFVTFVFRDFGYSCIKLMLSPSAPYRMYWSRNLGFKEKCNTARENLTRLALQRVQLRHRSRCNRLVIVSSYLIRYTSK